MFFIRNLIVGIHIYCKTSLSSTAHLPGIPAFWVGYHSKFPGKTAATSDLHPYRATEPWLNENFLSSIVKFFRIHNLRHTVLSLRAGRIPWPLHHYCSEFLIPEKSILFDFHWVCSLYLYSLSMFCVKYSFRRSMLLKFLRTYQLFVFKKSKCYPIATPLLCESILLISKGILFNRCFTWNITKFYIFCKECSGRR